MTLILLRVSQDTILKKLDFEFRANSTGFTVHVLTDDNTDPNQLTVNGGSSTTITIKQGSG